MAFLCPVRIRRNKKKKAVEDESLRGMPAMGRITGSASIETLVRVGLEKEAGLGPESKMVVLHDFNPCVDDELEVRRGQVVHVLYQENDWVYVISEDSREGFIPHSYTAQFGSQLAGLALNVKKKMPREQSISDQAERNNNTSQSGKVNPALEQSDTESFKDSSLRLGGGAGGEGQHSQSRSSSLLSESSSQPEVHPFFKDPFGRFIVLYSYHAQDENDLTVERGQCVTVLNKDDPEWFWVLRADGQEGFVPAGFVYPLDAIQRQQAMATSPAANISSEMVSPTGSAAHSALNAGGSLHSGRHTSPPATAQLSSGPPKPAATNQMPGGNNQLPVINNQLPGVTNQLTAGSNQLPGGNNQPPSGVNPTLPNNQLPGGNNQLPGGNVNSGGVSSGGGARVPGSGGGSYNQQEGRYSGTELVMLYDYKAQAPDDLSVRRGDWVYADLSNQTVDGWLWAYAPKTRKYGFIPKAYARPPAMTSL